MSKLIGITSSRGEGGVRLYQNAAYFESLTREGVTPILLPTFCMDNRELVDYDEFYETHKEHVERLVERLDGLVLSGGPDINPLTFDQSFGGASQCDSMRDYTELSFFRAFLAAQKPILGICRGFQMAGIDLGFPYFAQDINANLKPEYEMHQGADSDLKDRQEVSHSTFIFGDYARYLNEKKGKVFTSIKTNSWHHQGFIIPEFKRNKREVATLSQRIAEYELASPDGVKIIACTNHVVEGFEAKDSKTMTVQFHPEEGGKDSLTIQYWIDTYLNA